MKRPQIVLADEHRLVLDGLQCIVQHDFDVAGTARDGRTLVDLVLRTKPDLVLTEAALPLLSSIEAAIGIKMKLPQTHVVVLSKLADRDRLREALRAGVSGYLLMDCSGPELVSALHEILAGRCYITPRLTVDLFSVCSASPDPASSAPTLRQREVLKLVVEGHSLREISALLNISRKTVEYHKYGLMRSVGARNTAQLIQYALERGIAEQTNAPRSNAPRRLAGTHTRPVKFQHSSASKNTPCGS